MNLRPPPVLRMVTCVCLYEWGCFMHIEAVLKKNESNLLGEVIDLQPLCFLVHH